MNEPASIDTTSRNFVSAVICTCDRGDTVLLALRSLLACTHPNFEILLIDQSSDSRTQDSLQPYCADPRLRYIRSQIKGKGRSLNIAVKEARSDLIMLTDDDCEVPADWLDKMATLFCRFPNVAVAYCNVDAAPHDAKAGFISSYKCDPPRVLTRPGEAMGGIGAGMAVRKSHVVSLGGFDDRLGPGALFPSCDEQDLSERALLRGFAVCLTNDTCVVHHGFRTWEEGRQMVRRDCRAAGAVAGKLFRSGHRAMVFAPVRILWLFTLLLWEDAKRFRRPRGMGRIMSFLRGFMQGLRAPIDRATLRFTDPKEMSG
jgi:GT2 family glycosyltransferase